MLENFICRSIEGTTKAVSMQITLSSIAGESRVQNKHFAYAVYTTVTRKSLKTGSFKAEEI
ncbi:hypothetical protein T4B_10557 [Trichinella pseudospiralis]|uniref:Uncharacterized protein n=1 Tax=Trichinella pseudospiralis TaxID=6337 RepID=A0A0V1J6B3_TRIPS|nr:hypothetical protein T4B_10557 [Trichinella pseudospiralis]